MINNHCSSQQVKVLGTLIEEKQLHVFFLWPIRPNYLVMHQTTNMDDLLILLTLSDWSKVLLDIICLIDSQMIIHGRPALQWVSISGRRYMISGVLWSFSLDVIQLTSFSDG